MRSPIQFIPLLAALALSGCFLSAEPRIETGVLLADGNVSFCTPGDDPCQTGYPQEDGYIIRSQTDEEEDMTLRFEALVEAGGQMIYLGEAELREGDEAVWNYIVARAAGSSDDGLARFDVQLPGCSGVTDDQAALHALERTDAYSCTVTDLGKFRTFLIDTHAEQFADPDWWADS